MRRSRDELFMQVALLFAEQSTCNRGHVGTVIVQDNRIVSCGYNGSPPGHDHCLDVGCDPADGCLRTIHAEANAIHWAARTGVSLLGATMYATHAPCLTCAQAIAASGIKRFVYLNGYRLERLDVLWGSGIGVYRVVTIREGGQAIVPVKRQVNEGWVDMGRDDRTPFHPSLFSSDD